MRLEIAALVALSWLFFSLDAASQPPADQEVAALRAELARLTERLARLERSIAQSSAPAPVEEQSVAAQLPAAVATPWTETVELSGELRYRHETIDDDAVSMRHQHRIRARAAVKAQVARNMSVGFGLSTGGFTNDSGNQTLDEGFAFKDVGVDLAYLDWGITEELELIAGKVPNPFFRPADHHLIYDGDLRPEGLALKYSAGNLFGNAAAFWVEERAGEADAMLLGLQGGYRGTLDNGIGFTAGLSYYETTHTRGRVPIFTTDDGQGNQLDENGGYLYGFSEIELFSELELDLDGEPLTLFLDYVRNTDAGVFDEGYAIGASYRRLSVPGDWGIAYIYEDVEANAVVGAFTDSDFAGGTSDGSGHSLIGGYVFPGGWNFALRYIVGDRGEAAGNKRDYNRLQADINLRY
jgi:hypothetical protein